MLFAIRIFFFCPSLICFISLSNSEFENPIFTSIALKILSSTSYCFANSLRFPFKYSVLCDAYDIFKSFATFRVPVYSSFSTNTKLLVFSVFVLLFSKINFNMLDFPAPFLPTIATLSPLFTSKEVGLNIALLSYFICNPSAKTNGFFLLSNGIIFKLSLLSTLFNKLDFSSIALSILLSSTLERFIILAD